MTRERREEAELGWAAREWWEEAKLGEMARKGRDKAGLGGVAWEGREELGGMAREQREEAELGQIPRPPQYVSTAEPKACPRIATKMAVLVSMSEIPKPRKAREKKGPGLWGPVAEAVAATASPGRSSSRGNCCVSSEQRL